MKAKDSHISVTEFKKHFLGLVDEVKNKRSSFIITKRKMPYAKISPLDSEADTPKKPIYGCMKGTVTIKDDIVNFDFSDEWEANND